MCLELLLQEGETYCHVGRTLHENRERKKEEKHTLV